MFNRTSSQNLQLVFFFHRDCKTQLTLVFLEICTNVSERRICLLFLLLLLLPLSSEIICLKSQFYLATNCVLVVKNPSFLRWLCANGSNPCSLVNAKIVGKLKFVPSFWYHKLWSIPNFSNKFGSHHMNRRKSPNVRSFCHVEVLTHLQLHICETPKAFVYQYHLYQLNPRGRAWGQWGSIHKSWRQETWNC